VTGRSDFLKRWEDCAAQLAKYGAHVDGNLLIREILNDVESVFAAEEGEKLSLEEAANLSGYSRDHIGRLIRSGSLPNAGRHGRPRVRRADLPRKPKGLPDEAGTDIVFSSSKRQIAQSVVTSPHERNHDD